MNQIKPKKKPCKSCKGKDYLKHGFCPECFKNWLFNTPEGKAKLNKILNFQRKIIKKIKKAELKQRKIELISKDDYRAKYIQPVINEIARLIDYGQPCIATGNYPRKPQGGHYFSCGSNRVLCLNLHNIFLQSYESNCEKSGDNLRFRDGLKRVYGQKYLDYVESLKSIPALNLSKNDLIEIYSKVRKIRNSLKKNPIIHTPEERIKLREKLNQEIGIYNTNYKQLK